MKKVISLILAIIFCLSLCGTALADEQTTETEAEKSILEIFDDMIYMGAKLDAASFVNHTKESDPNQLIGSVGQYISKLDFNCLGYKKTGGTIEGYDINDAANTKTRFDYIKNIYIGYPAFADEVLYLYDNYLLRVNKKISKEDSYALARLFSETTELPVMDVFDIKQELSLEELNTPEDAATAEGEVIENSNAIVELKSGDKGNHVAKMQHRLKQLEYYKGSISGKLDGGTMKAFNTFQEKNGREITETVNKVDQRILYSNLAVTFNGEQAEAYLPFKVSPLTISKVAVKQAKGVPYATFTVKNESYCSVVAFSYSVKFFDEDGNQLTENQGEYKAVYNSKELKVGKSVTVNTNRAYDMYNFLGAKTCKVAITRIMMSDGTIVNYDSPVWAE